MRKLYTVHIASAGVQEDFHRKGIPPLAVLEVLKVHLDKVQSGKQVFSIRLEDGTPEPKPEAEPKRKEAFSTTRARIDDNRRDLDAALDIIGQLGHPGAKLQLVLSMVEDLAKDVRSAVQLFALPGQPSQLRGLLLDLQACREAFDDLAVEANEAEAKANA